MTKDDKRKVRRETLSEVREAWLSARTNQEFTTWLADQMLEAGAHLKCVG